MDDVLMEGYSNLTNGFLLQYSLLIQSFGFNTAQTTALNIPAGVVQIVSITLATIILHFHPVCSSGPFNMYL